MRSAISRQLDLFANFRTVQKPVSVSFNIEPAVLSELVECGIFEDYDMDLPAAVSGFLHKLPEFRNAVRDDNEDEEMDLTADYTVMFEKAYEIIQEAMECVRDNNCARWCSQSEYVDEVYHYYAINSACNGERSLPYCDFLRCCTGFTSPV